MSFKISFFNQYYLCSYLWSSKCHIIGCSVCNDAASQTVCIWGTICGNNNGRKRFDMATCGESSRLKYIVSFYSKVGGQSPNPFFGPLPLLKIQVASQIKLLDHHLAKQLILMSKLVYKKKRWAILGAYVGHLRWFFLPCG